MIYLFNNYQIDTDNFALKCEEKLIEVEPLVFNLIVYLIENKSKVVSREELLENVWQGRIVLDATLNNHIKSARNALSDNGQSQNVIRTIHSRGYQFVAEIKTVPDQTINKPHSNAHKKNLQYFLLLVMSSILIFLLTKNSSIIPQQTPQQLSENKSIAVLAFLDMSPEQNQEYFSDGISEEILNKLAQIPELRVISRTSSFFFKGKDDTAKQIGEQLKVSHLLEGSVRKHNDKVRITVQLIDSKTANHLWSETYDKPMNDIFEIQDDIADAVSEKLKISLLSKTNKSNIAHPDAYNIYLQARYLIAKATKDDVKKAELLLKKSLAFDPIYAPAWQQLGATVFKLTFNYGQRSINDGIKTSTYAINKAIALNPNFAPSYATLARIQSQQRRFIDSDKTLQKALELDPNNSYINDMAAFNAMFAGSFDLALEFREKIKNTDPKYYKNYYGIGILKYFNKDLEGAYTALKKFENAKPDADIIHYLLCSVLIAQGKPKLAYIHAKKEKNKFWKLYAINLALFAVGEIKQSNTVFEKFIDRYSNSDLASIARIYAFRGNIEQSFKWLHKAFDHPDSSLIHFLNFPDFYKMHKDPRWHELIRKMKFPDSHWLVKKLP